jgi:hypothetical protein
MLCFFVYRLYDNGETYSGHVGSNGNTFRKLRTGNTLQGAAVAKFNLHFGVDLKSEKENLQSE